MSNTEPVSEAPVSEAPVSEAPVSETPKKNFISVTKGRAYFAVEYWFNPEGFWEPFTTSGCYYRTEAEAEVEAKEWAEEEGLEYKPKE